MFCRAWGECRLAKHGGNQKTQRLKTVELNWVMHKRRTWGESLECSGKAEASNILSTEQCTAGSGNKTQVRQVRCCAAESGRGSPTRVTKEVRNSRKLNELKLTLN